MADRVIEPFIPEKKHRLVFRLSLPIMSSFLSERIFFYFSEKPKSMKSLKKSRNFQSINDDISIVHFKMYR